MAEGYRRSMNKIHEFAPNSTQILGAAALVTLGAVLLSIVGLTGVVLAPVLVLLSPVLIPVGALLFVTFLGLFSAGLFVAAVVFGALWFYNYWNGRRPPGSDQVDYARMRVVDTTEGYNRFMNKIHEFAPNSTQILGSAALVTLGAILLFFAGLAAVILGPFFILLSPILIPLGALLLFSVLGLFSAGCLGLATFLGVSWFYNYLNGRHPPGSDQVDYARMRIVDTANHVKDYAKEYGGYLHGKRRDAAPGA